MVFVDFFLFSHSFIKYILIGIFFLYLEQKIYLLISVMHIKIKFLIWISSVLNLEGPSTPFVSILNKQFKTLDFYSLYSILSLLNMSQAIYTRLIFQSGLCLFISLLFCILLCIYSSQHIHQRICFKKEVLKIGL